MSSEKEPLDDRYTFACTSAMKQRLEDEAYRQGKKSSYLARLAIETYLDSIQGTRPPAAVEENQIKELAAQIARRLGMDLASFTNKVLIENMQRYVQEVKEHEAQIKSLIEQAYPKEKKG